MFTLAENSLSPSLAAMRFVVVEGLAAATPSFLSRPLALLLEGLKSMVDTLISRIFSKKISLKKKSTLEEIPEISIEIRSKKELNQSHISMTLQKILIHQVLSCM